jgi:hypothetical protein
VDELIAVVETEEFLADVKRILSEDEHDALIWYGSRVIYYFHSMNVPLFLMAIFAKNIQTDLSPQQRKALAREILALKADWKRRKTK